MEKIEFFRILKLQPVCLEKQLLQKFNITQCSVIVERIHVNDFHPKRARGRPRKSALSADEIKQLINSDKINRLSAHERQYHEMRLRNNEASRRARLKCKAVREALCAELVQLEALNEELIARERKLDEEVKLWEQKIINLIKSE